MNFIQFKNMPTETEMVHNKNLLEKYDECKKKASNIEILSFLILIILEIACVYLSHKIHLGFAVPAGIIGTYLYFRLFTYQVHIEEWIVEKLTRYQTGMAEEKVKELKDLISYYEFFSDCIMFEKNNDITYLSVEFTNLAVMDVEMKGISPTGAFCEYSKAINFSADKCSKQINKDNMYQFDFSDFTLLVPCDKEGNIISYLSRSSDEQKKNKQVTKHFQQLTDDEKSMICDICYHNQHNITQEKLDEFCEKCFLS